MDQFRALPRAGRRHVADLLAPQVAVTAANSNGIPNRHRMNFEFELHFCSINKGSPAVLPGKPLEQRRPAGRDRRARCVEHHPNERVVAHQADGIEDALLAELRDRAGIGGVADAAVLQQFRAEVIQRFRG